MGIQSTHTKKETVGCAVNSRKYRLLERFRFQRGKDRPPSGTFLPGKSNNAL